MLQYMPLNWVYTELGVNNFLICRLQGWFSSNSGLTAAILNLQVLLLANHSFAVRYYISLTKSSEMTSITT
jgi:hypothetical protein